MSSLRALMDEVLSWPRIQLFLWMLGVEIAVFLIASMLPLSPATTHSLGATYSSTSSRIQTMSLPTMWATIASNNLIVSMIDSIPGFGFLTFLPAVYNSGLLVNAAATTSLHTVGIAAALLLFIFPHTIIEMSAYALAASAGFSLGWAALKRRLKQEFRIYLFQVGLVVGLIAIAGLAETLAITFTVEAGLFWFLVFYFVFRVKRHIQENSTNIAENVT